jgi:hypothetical protein
VEFGGEVSVAAVMYADDAEWFSACLILDRHDRTWWVPARLLECPSAGHPRSARWSWVGGTTDSGGEYLLVGSHELVRHGWSVFEGVLDRSDDAVAAADSECRQTAMRDRLTSKVRDFGDGEITFVQLADWASTALDDPHTQDNVSMALYEITGRQDAPDNRAKFVEAVLADIT